MSDQINSPPHYAQGEEWRPVPGYEGIYEISDMGRVYSLKTKTHRAPGRWGGRYCVINFYRDGRASKAIRLHRLVADVFLPKPLSCAKKLVVNHKNGDVADNRADNLEWCSHSDNNLHAIDTGLRGIRVGLAAKSTDLSTRDRMAIRRLKAAGVSISLIATSFNASESVIGDICATADIPPQRTI